jgi:hypothetical protein
MFYLSAILSAQLWLGACHPTEHCTESAHPEGSIRFRLAAARTPAIYASASLFLSTGPSESDELSRSSACPGEACPRAWPEGGIRFADKDMRQY